MSATQLAAFVVASVVAAGLAGLAIVLVLRARRAGTYHQIRDGFSSPVGLLAAALLVGAGAVFGLGTVVATKTYSVPVAPASPVTRCEPGTYDNGGDRYDGPVCVPWPGGGPR